MAEPAATIETRGRPRLRGDAEILGAAIRAFAAAGFDGMSLRSLNRDLGLSHGTINQRFGSKEQLFYAAVDHDFGALMAEVAAELAIRPPAGDEIEQLRDTIRAFLVASARRPELLRLMNQEGLTASPRLAYIFDRFVRPTIESNLSGLQRLADRGVVRPHAMRSVFFLMTHGAAAPFTLAALSRHFDEADGEVDDDEHAQALADIIVAGLLA